MAAREGDDVVVIDTCRGGAPTVSFPSSKLVEPNVATRVKRDNSGRNFVVRAMLLKLAPEITPILSLSRGYTGRTKIESLLGLQESLKEITKMSLKHS